MKKLVLKVEVHDHKAKSKAMQAVSGFEGVGSLTMDMQAKKLTVSGDFDPVKVVQKLRKSWHTEIVSVEPAKGGDDKKDEDKKKEDQVKVFPAYYSPPLTYCYVSPYEENPNCVIC